MYNQALDTEEKLNKLYVIRGNKTEEVKELHAGDIGAIGKLSAKTGDTLCTKNNVVMYARTEMSKPYTYKSYKAKNKGDEDKISQALGRLMEEDLTLKVVNDSANRQTLIYGMGEKQIVAIAKSLENASLQDASAPAYRLEDIPQIAYLTNHPCLQEGEGGRLLLHSHEDALKSKRVHAENFRLIETESNKINAATIIQAVGNQYVVVNPPYPTMSTEELDAIYDLPFQYHPHPKYKGKHIPAYEMIRFSVCMHRGCFGACSFCTISAHQGKQIASRSQASILRQIDKLKAEIEALTPVVEETEEEEIDYESKITVLRSFLDTLVDCGDIFFRNRTADGGVFESVACARFLGR